MNTLDFLKMLGGIALAGLVFSVVVYAGHLSGPVQAMGLR